LGSSREYASVLVSRFDGKLETTGVGPVSRARQELPLVWARGLRCLV
jgi:hypothetical protein